MTEPSFYNFLSTSNIAFSSSAVKTVSLCFKTSTERTTLFLSSYYPVMVCRHTIEQKKKYYNIKNIKELFHEKNEQLATQTRDAT